MVVIPQRDGQIKDGSARSEVTRAELSQRYKDSERLHYFLSLIIIAILLKQNFEA